MKDMNNATCSICGNPYYMCVTCRDMINLHPWKRYTDTANCYQVYQAVRGFSTKIYTKEEFKSKLKNIDLSNLENYREHIKVLIKDALKDGEVVETVAEPVSIPYKKNKVNNRSVKIKADITESDNIIEIE